MLDRVDAASRSKLRVLMKTNLTTEAVNIILDGASWCKTAHCARHVKCTGCKWPTGVDLAA